MKKIEQIALLKELIFLMDNYISVLGKELDDCYPYLTCHGWKSKRVDEGRVARDKILAIKHKLNSL